MSLFENNIKQIYGDHGKTWLSTLAKQVHAMSRRHNLSKLMPVIHLSYNYVLSGFQGEQPIILKLGLDISQLRQEAAALRALTGFGVVNILAEEDGMLLLKQVLPGISLKSYFPTRENEAIRVACRVMKRLHNAPRCSTATFPRIENWLAELDKSWDIPTHYLQTARKIRDHLMTTSTESVLLHGDLHHDNILESGESWIVIDPKGVIGEPAFEVAAFIRNPIPELLSKDSAATLIEHRMATFATLLNLPEIRILQYGFITAILSWIWALEDHCDADYFKKLTSIFYKVLN